MDTGRKILKSRWAAIVRDRRGAIAIIFALSGFVLFGFAGLVADMGYWYGTHGALQVAADAGAMAAARMLPYSMSSDNATMQLIAQNAADQASSTLQVNPTVTYSVTGNGSGRIVTVVAEAPEQLFFSEVLGHVAGILHASAQAGEAGTQSACILGLDQGNPAAVYVNDTAATVNSPNCAIYSDGGVTNKNGTINTQVVSAVGSITGNYEPQTELLPNTGNVVADPYASLPAPSTTGMIDYDNLYASPTGPLGTRQGNTCTSYQQILPGKYNGIDINSNSCVNFQPGIYYINSGDFTLNGNDVITWGCPSSTTCSSTIGGVMFYFGGSNPGTLQWNGNSNSVSLSAPTSGTYAGMLVYQSQSTPLVTGCNTPGGYCPVGSEASISGNSTFNLTGALYFPNTGVYFNGNSTSGPTTTNEAPGIGVNIVAQTIEIGGNATLNTGNPLSNGTNVGGTPYLSG